METNFFEIFKEMIEKSVEAAKAIEDPKDRSDAMTNIAALLQDSGIMSATAIKNIDGTYDMKPAITPDKETKPKPDRLLDFLKKAIDSDNIEIIGANIEKIDSSNCDGKCLECPIVFDCKDRKMGR